MAQYFRYFRSSENMNQLNSDVMREGEIIGVPSMSSSWGVTLPSCTTLWNNPSSTPPGNVNDNISNYKIFEKASHRAKEVVLCPPYYLTAESMNKEIGNPNYLEAYPDPAGQIVGSRKDRIIYNNNSTMSSSQAPRKYLDNAGIALMEGEGKIRETQPDIALAYSTMKHNMSILTNIQRTILNILRLAVTNSEGEIPNHFYQNICADPSFQARLHSLASHQQMIQAGTEPNTQPGSDYKYPQTFKKDSEWNGEIRSGSYLGPEQTEPLDLSLNAVNKEAREPKRNFPIRRRRGSCKNNISIDTACQKNNLIREKCEIYKDINNNENNNLQYRKIHGKKKQKARLLKDNFSRQIIEYNWNKKKCAQRRRFKMRKCKGNKEITSINISVSEDHNGKIFPEASKIPQTFDVESKRKFVEEIKVVGSPQQNLKLTEADTEDEVASGTVQSADDPTPATADPRRVCLSNIALTEGLRVLLIQGGVFYPGLVSCVAPPDIYSVRIEGERRNRQHVLAREQLVKQAIREAGPACVSELCPGARVCALWSSKIRCLYPGTVLGLGGEQVTILFDDGDSRDCHVTQVRYLPDTSMPILTGQGMGKKVEEVQTNKNRRLDHKKVSKSEMLPAWCWADEGYKVPSRSRHVYHDRIARAGVTVCVGDAVYLHSPVSSPSPYIGRVHTIWETNSQAKVVVRWLYQADQVMRGREEQLKTEGGLFESDHYDENYVHSIAQPCTIVELSEVLQTSSTPQYYIAGEYHPVDGTITYRPGVLVVHPSTT